MTHRFTITDWPEFVDVYSNETILDALLRVGVPIFHGCRSGTCGACKARLVSGNVELGSHSIYALTERDHTDGLVLTCRAFPVSGGTITRLGSGEVVGHPLFRLECEVGEITALTDEIHRIRLRVVTGGRFAFSAGQFVSVTFAGQPPRDYSMANRPSDPVLEFHIRRVNGGASSVHATTELSVGDSARVDGPYGACWLRESHTGAIIAVAGGSGLAPMKSIIETALAKGMRQLIKLYVAAPSECDLYMEDHFRELERRFENFTFLPVLQSSDHITKRRVCTVHDVVLTDGYDFTEVEVYAAGPPEMVDGLTRTLISHGVQPTDIHTEPFHVAVAEPMQEEGRD